MSEYGLSQKIEYYLEAGRLKLIPRTGWVDRGIPNPETVAEHSFRTALITYDLAKLEGEDPLACATMAMIHDLQESQVGDITKNSGVSKEQKKQMELKAAQQLAKLHENDEFLAMFIELEEGQTPRARIIKDADQIEAVVQALEYARAYPEKQELVENFWPHAQKRITTEAGKKMFEALLQEKQKTNAAPKQAPRAWLRLQVKTL